MPLLAHMAVCSVLATSCMLLLTTSFMFLACSPVDNVHAAAYPHMLVLAGLHDPRVGAYASFFWCWGLWRRAWVRAVLRLLRRCR